MTKKLALGLVCLSIAGLNAVSTEICRADVVVAVPAVATASPVAAALEKQTIAIAPQCVASTIGIVVSKQEGDRTSIADGSGVVVSAEGLILTAGHVADKSGTPLVLRFTDGKVVKGVSLGVDRETDTGMARITDAAPAGGWPFSPVAPADSATVGEWVLATGNPGSIVVDRNPPIRLGRVIGHGVNTIESTCDIEPGDSGGPLFDLKGRVVGINSRIAVMGGDNGHGQPMQSFHVPVSLYSAHWDDLVAGKNAHLGSSIGGMRPRLWPRGMPDPLRFRQALDKLIAQKDSEALKLVADAEKNSGKMPLTEGQAERLIARAGLSSRPDGPTTRNAPAEDPAKDPVSPTAAMPNPLRLAEALSKLAAAKDEEALKLLADAQKNGGKMDLTPEQADRLIKKANLPSRSVAGATTRSAGSGLAQPGPTTAEASGKEIPSLMRPFLRMQVRHALHQQFPNADVSDALVDRILDKSSFDPATGHLNIAPGPDDLKAMGISPNAIVNHFGGPRQSRAGQEFGKTSLKTLALFAPGLDAAGDCVVEIRSGDKIVMMGTVVDADGWIVTKASDLPAHPMVALPNGKVLDATVAGKDEATDLALLKVKAKGLPAVKFAESAPLGEWLASPLSDPNRPAVGIVSVAARPIPEKFAHFAGEQKVILGLGFSGTDCLVAEVLAGMPAEKAGIKAGDRILELNGEPVSDSHEFTARIKRAKTGDTLTIKLRRDGKEMEFTPLLGEIKTNTSGPKGIGEVDNLTGGTQSKRRSGFPMAIQHDTELSADQCGGPLINLSGETVGINIARYDHVCTFAIPADLVQKTVATLRAEQK